MKGICKLYDVETELRDSHIIPKFVFDYTKKTGSRFLRNFANPNQRVQDGFKRRILSEKAEQLFSKKEKWFAENIFRPYLEDSENPLSYDENLMFFAISVLWRSLICHLTEPNIQSQPYVNKLKLVAADWKSYLLGNQTKPQFSKIYLLLTNRVSWHLLDSDEADYYLTRAIDTTIVANDPPTFVAVYAKFNRFAFWATVHGGNPKGLNELKIAAGRGSLSFPQQWSDPYMQSFFKNRLKQLSNLPPVSENQKKVIENDFERNKEAFLDSDAAAAMRNDLRLKSYINNKK
ncbi:hypothetical protein SAMN05216327_117155 [Dyadobacter sp. SG02]|uniref:hypothetical protein n=1 Tax=Dyadobacter sp. SG02 TaxID=1855291 RepID=UPI0008D291DD|nr:hypothetical protein [Dyadobacter sp. SG02]SEJ73305.1 hypothetical protein SAMN05216327_117155 [Dyadobacter sp. SG02]